MHTYIHKWGRENF